jgi:hypothetical protein
VNWRDLSRWQTNRAGPGREETGDMAYQPKPNTCGLFKNDRNDKSDLSGQIEIEYPRCHASAQFSVNGWNKLAQSGKSYIHLALKLKSKDATAASRDKDGGL